MKLLLITYNEYDADHGIRLFDDLNSNETRTRLQQHMESVFDKYHKPYGVRHGMKATVYLVSDSVTKLWIRYSPDTYDLYPLCLEHLNSLRFDVSSLSVYEFLDGDWKCTSFPVSEECEHPTECAEDYTTKAVEEDVDTSVKTTEQIEKEDCMLPTKVSIDSPIDTSERDGIDWAELLSDDFEWLDIVYTTAVNVLFCKIDAKKILSDQVRFYDLCKSFCYDNIHDVRTVFRHLTSRRWTNSAVIMGRLIADNSFDLSFNWSDSALTQSEEAVTACDNLKKARQSFYLQVCHRTQYEASIEIY
jgi:hypothetical protein